ncbi:MAG: HPr family phosphocarrier protein [Proteobacteria bacterium]|nr:HPr family phosphocarrier protein [Pseudomonadota bacterium]
MAAPDDSGGGQCRLLTIINKRGLHARAAAKFVAAAAGFAADIDVTRSGQTVSGRSIMGLMMLAASPGTEIEVRAVGKDAGAALDAIQALVERKFDED